MKAANKKPSPDADPKGAGAIGAALRARDTDAPAESEKGTFAAGARVSPLADDGRRHSTLAKLDRVIDLLEVGRSARRACSEAGLGRATFHGLRASKRHGPRIEAAIEAGLARLEGTVETAAEADWRAAQALLQVRDPATWSAKAQVALAVTQVGQPASASTSPKVDLSRFTVWELRVVAAIHRAALNRIGAVVEPPRPLPGSPEWKAQQRLLENIERGAWPRFVGHIQPEGSPPSAQQETT